MDLKLLNTIAKHGYHTSICIWCSFTYNQAPFFTICLLYVERYAVESRKCQGIRNKRGEKNEKEYCIKETLCLNHWLGQRSAMKFGDRKLRNP